MIYLIHKVNKRKNTSVFIVKHNPKFTHINGYNIRSIEIWREAASDELYHATEVSVTYCIDKKNAGAPEAWVTESTTYLSREFAQVAIEKIMAWALSKKP